LAEPATQFVETLDVLRQAVLAARVG